MSFNGYNNGFTPSPIGNYNNNGYLGYNPFGTPSAAQMQPMQRPQPPQPQQPIQAQPQAQMPIKTNIIFVTSAEDALNRYADPYSQAIYFHQDEPFGFRVTTDAVGKKTIDIFRMEMCSFEEMQNQIRGVKKTELEDYVTKGDLTQVENRLIQYIKDNLPPIVKPHIHEAVDTEHMEE